MNQPAASCYYENLDQWWWVPQLIAGRPLHLGQSEDS